MTNSKNTRRALMTSALAILMCVAMLIGTTFAWFTDTASTAVNKIQAGTLDIALEMKVDNEWVDAEGKTLEFKKADGAAEGEKVLWEPGCTYELPEVRLVNNGDLALKYKIVLSGIKGDAKLNEAIEWTIGGLDLDTEGTLRAGAASDALTIKGHMKEDAGNEYQGLSIDGIAITVYATQYTYEHDSIDDQYDRHSTYPVEIIAEIKDAELTKETVIDSESGKEVEVFSYANSDSTAKVSVPATGVSEDATPVVSIKPTEADTTASATIKTEGKDAIAYDISITNLDGTTKATIEIYIGKGLTGVEIFHNDTKMDEGDFSYDSETGYITIKSATFSPFTIAYDATLFEGNGSKDNPFIIKNVTDLGNIKTYGDSYNYYKVADGVTEIDCTNFKGTNLNGSFDGNGVTFKNVTGKLFGKVGTSTDDDAMTLKNFTAEMNGNGTGVVYWAYTSSITFENVKVTGTIDGHWNVGAFVEYGPGENTSGYDLYFKNCSCDAAIKTTGSSFAAVLVGHPYCDSGNTVNIYVDADTDTNIQSAKIYATGSSVCGYKYYGTTTHATVNVYVDNVQKIDSGWPYDNARGKISATQIQSIAPAKTDDGYSITAAENATRIEIIVGTQLSGYEEDNKTAIGQQSGITMSLGVLDLANVTGGSTVSAFGKVSSIEVVNGRTEKGRTYELSNGAFTIYTGDGSNYITGNVTLTAKQYDTDGVLISTGTLVIAERATVDSSWAVK